MNTPPYVEENFGILTDDDLYLDAILVKPVNLTDEKLRVLRVWVPKFPLTKSSVITCARQEVKSYGPDGRIAHLVFDLRGTGESDGVLGRHNFKLDLSAIAAWSEERFGKINFGFLGTPTIREGRVNVWPLRSGAVMETYYYPAVGTQDLVPPTVVYLSTYGHFGQSDEKMCRQLAQDGYAVYGLDPLRYLLHASVPERLTPQMLWEDLRLFIQMLPGQPIVIGQPMSAGLALLWSAGTDKVQAVIAIGRAQAGLQPPHIFANENPYTFMLSRHIGRLSARPLVIVRQNGHPLGGEDEELTTLFQSSQEPHRLETVNEVTDSFLLRMLSWTQSVTLAAG
ncbi:MAG: hypothetical protein IPM39_02295 [Chloroflexi bacterium]|nr:hypothetical protein [Chloroflexota bacterium]